MTTSGKINRSEVRRRAAEGPMAGQTSAALKA
jgi:hypothetical protein